MKTEIPFMSLPRTIIARYNMLDVKKVVQHRSKSGEIHYTVQTYRGVKDVWRLKAISPAIDVEWQREGANDE